MSPSKIIGLVVTSKIWSILLNLSALVKDSLSGFPSAVESVNELDQNPSKLASAFFFLQIKFSAIIADMGLCVSIILRKFLIQEAS